MWVTSEYVMVRVKCGVVQGRERGKEGSERGKGGKKGKTLFYIKNGKRVYIYMKFLVIGTSVGSDYIFTDDTIFTQYIMILITDVTQILLIQK